MASLPCSHFFVALLVHLRQVHPLVCVVALLVHFLLWQAAKPSGDKCPPLYALFALLVQRRQVHPLYVRCCFVGALLALASGKAERRQVHPLGYKTSNLPL